MTVSQEMMMDDSNSVLQFSFNIKSMSIKLLISIKNKINESCAQFLYVQAQSSDIFFIPKYP